HFGQGSADLERDLPRHEARAYLHKLRRVLVRHMVESSLAIALPSLDKVTQERALQTGASPGRSSAASVAGLKLHQPPPRLPNASVSGRGRRKADTGSSACSIICPVGTSTTSKAVSPG